MDDKVLVGVLIGLVVGSSTYIWNSESFTKPQKIGLLFCLVFPPLQWIGMIVVLIYNNYNSIYSTEKVAERKVEEVKNVFDSSILNLNNLKQKGILTDEEYNQKVNKINAEKDEQNLKNSVEYRQLQSLLDSGILTKEEFESKVRLIKEAPIKKVSVEEVERLKAYVENIKLPINDEPKKENSNKIFVYLFVAVIVVLFLLFIISQNKKISSEQNYDLPPEPVIESIDSNTYETTHTEVKKDFKIFVYATVDYKRFEPVYSDNGFYPVLKNEGKTCTKIFELYEKELINFKQEFYSSVDVQHYNYRKAIDGFGYLTYPETVDILTFTTMDEANKYQMKNCHNTLTTFFYFSK